MRIAAQKALVVLLLALPLGAASSVPSAKPRTLEFPRSEQVVGVLMVQTSNQEANLDFENMVMQSIIE
jgi:hypothetical protein